MDRYIQNQEGLHIHLVEHVYDEDRLFLLSHGFTGSVQSHVIASIRSYLNEQQISNVSIDFTNNLNASDGEFCKQTIAGEVRDLDAVYKHYRDRFKHIFLIGHSMGCTVSAEYALHYPVDGLLLVAPPFSIRDIIGAIAKATYGDERLGLAKWKREGMIPIYKEKDKAYYPLAYEFYRDLCEIDPEDYRQIMAPTVVIYSSADPVVPPEDSKRLFEVMGSMDKKLIMIPDAPHSFDQPSSSKALVEEVGLAIAHFMK